MEVEDFILRYRITNITTAVSYRDLSVLSTRSDEINQLNGTIP